MLSGRRETTKLTQTLPQTYYTNYRRTIGRIERITTGNFFHKKLFIISSFTTYPKIIEIGGQSAFLRFPLFVYPSKLNSTQRSIRRKKLKDLNSVHLTMVRVEPDNNVSVNQIPSLDGVSSAAQSETYSTNGILLT